MARFDVEELAVELTRALRLTTSVQDWCATSEDAYFLEANPQGGWSFLSGYEKRLLPAFVEHLGGSIG
jgi:hypothetical protein